jgi:hypothetical protein
MKKSAGRIFLNLPTQLSIVMFFGRILHSQISAFIGAMMQSLFVYP